MPGRLLVKRKGFTTKTGVRVKPTSFFIKDRGRRGRGPTIIPPLKPNGLGGKGFFSRTREQRFQTAARLAKKEGEKRVVGRLRAIQVLTKRTSPATSRKARTTARMIAGAFVGKKRVRRGTGFA